jgi:ADP-ribose pyrophosphatase YjhB (NUDIX family)
MKTALIHEINRLRSIADIGLLYSSNDYDRERYLEIKEISFNLLHAATGHEVESIRERFPLGKDYPTAKVDVRGLLLSPQKKILLVKESADQKWSLPGGWADVGFSPKEVIIKEFKEETGFDIIPEKLLAVFDKKMHEHPPQLFYVYKLVFFCTPISTEILKGFDVLDVDYFDVEHLPPLSEDRILKSQIRLLYNKIMSSSFEAYVD